MLLQSQVKNWFISAINNHKDASNELKRALTSKGSMINAYLKLLHKELVQADAEVAKRKGKGLKADTIKWFVVDMANNFVIEKERLANAAIQSDIKRLSIETEKQKQKDLDSTFKGQAAGDYKEYIDEGSLILDETQLQRPNPAVKSC